MTRLSPIDKWILVFVILVLGVLYFGTLAVRQAGESSAQETRIERLKNDIASLDNDKARMTKAMETAVPIMKDAATALNKEADKKREETAK